MNESSPLAPRPVNGSVGVPSFPTVVLTGSYVSSSVDVPARTRRVAILGFSDTVRDAPVSDPSWELWGMNGFWRAAKPDFGIDVPEDRFSLWFDMHSVDYTRAYGQAAGFGDAQERWLEKEHPFPVFMLDESPAFPSVRAYPLEQATAAVGRQYMTSTIAYAMAYAMSLPDVAEVGLWGIDLAHGSEYADQRPCAEYLIGRAEGLGIKVSIHERSALLRQRFLYGYEGHDDLSADLLFHLDQQIKSSEDTLAKLKAQHEALLGEMHTNDGALQMAKAERERILHWRRGGRLS